MNMKPLLISVACLFIVAMFGFGAFAQDNPRPPAGSKSTSTAKEPTGSKVVPLGGIEKATPITKEEAAQKYPPHGKGYPTAEITQGPESGASTTVVQSPYPPHQKYDVSDIPRGGLVLDTRAKHVFVRP
jgi:hypothetical protein